MFSQTTKPLKTVSTNNYPFSFDEKTYKKNSLGSKFSNKIQTAISGTIHTVTTEKNKILHKKLISNPLPFQSNTTPTKRMNTRQTAAEQPSCSKSTDPRRHANTEEKNRQNPTHMRIVRTRYGERPAQE